MWVTMGNGKRVWLNMEHLQASIDSMNKKESSQLQNREIAKKDRWRTRARPRFDRKTGKRL